MSDFKFIEYTPGLYPQINEFWQSTGLGGSYRGDNEEIIEGTIQAGGHLILMVDDSGLIIGTSWLTNDKRRTYIHHFGIKEEYRGKGLAGKLLEKSMELARIAGYQVKLEVHHDNLPARKLYENYGFKYLGDYDVMIIRELNNS